MPKSSQPFRLSPKYVEWLHDSVIAAVWPTAEPVGKDEYRDRPLLESAANAPFQAVFEIECYRTIFQQAACLFFLIIANHPFINGNKRTAVLSLHTFLLANSYWLLLDNEKTYQLAKDAAAHNEHGIDHKDMIKRIARKIRSQCIIFEDLDKRSEIFKYGAEAKDAVRRHPLNRPKTEASDE